MSRYLIELAYNGKDYHGWQVQNNARTVQGVLTEAVGLLLRDKEVEITGCGRTDTGVHAKQYFAHFDTEVDFDADKLQMKLNRFLPTSIYIYSVCPIDTDFHARFSALSREYKYYISKVKDPFDSEYLWHVSTPLDVDLMNEACRILFDYVDFTSFSKLHTQTKTNDCRMMEAYWQELGNRLEFTIKADRFLRNMVRAIVGTMVEIGSKKMNFSAFREVIESKNRSNAGVSVPANALFLNKIEYDFALFTKK